MFNSRPPGTASMPLSATFAVQRDTRAWQLQVWISFGIAVFLCATGLAWLPGERLAFGWRLPSFEADQTTEVDVRFEAVGGETRVTVEHRGWDSIPQKHVARHGFELMLFQRRLGEFWRGLLKDMETQL